ncbi:MAG: hypothetical protein WDN04_07435 [Rhodospirillales bacterium]
MTGTPGADEDHPAWSPDGKTVPTPPIRPAASRLAFARPLVAPRKS